MRRKQKEIGLALAGMILAFSVSAARSTDGICTTTARDGVPQARQVAARWQLLKNTGNAPESLREFELTQTRYVIYKSLSIVQNENVQMTNWIMLIIAVLLMIIALYSLFSYIRDKRSKLPSLRRKK